MSLTEVAVVAASLLGGGGVAAAVGALIKAPKEAGRIAVTASEGAVIVQTNVITNLNHELDKIRERMTLAEARVDDLEVERDQLRVAAAEAKAEVTRAKQEASHLKRRVTVLEKQIRSLGHTPADGHWEA